MLRPSTAPRWKIAISCFVLREAPAANAVRARNDGAKPRLTRANAPFFRKILREVMFLPSLKFRRAKEQCDPLRRRRGLAGRRERCLRDVARERSFDRALPAGERRGRDVHEPAAERRQSPAACA